MLIGGEKGSFSVADLQQNTVYKGFSATEPYILSFWEIIHGFDDEQRSRLLMFVTSCSRPPLLGFKNLKPSFTIARYMEDDKLPTSATCFNMLKLPVYSSVEELKSKLIIALKECEGFGLA